MLRRVLRQGGRHRLRRRPAGQRPADGPRRPRQGRGACCRRRSRCRGSVRARHRGCSATSSPCARASRGPSITLSRTHPNLVRKLFALEVPEIADGTVEIVALAREAGHRTKIAVRSDRSGRQRQGRLHRADGQRVRAVMAELHGEKIDIVDWSEDPAAFVAQALSPARVSRSRWSTSARARRGSSSPTTSSRSPSARRARTPGWPPGSPAGGSTSGPTWHRGASREPLGRQGRPGPRRGAPAGRARPRGL